MLESPVPGAIVFAIMLVFLVAWLIKYNAKAESLNGSTHSDPNPYASREIANLARD